MPEMDGFMVAERVRKQWGATQPVILMLTSANQNGDAQRCRELGISLHLIKPIRQLELLEALKQTLSGYRVVKQDEAPKVASQNAGAGSLRLLLAEDNPVNQKLAVSLLKKWGHSVH